MPNTINKSTVKKYKEYGLIELKKAHGRKNLRIEKYGFTVSEEDKFQYMESVAEEINNRFGVMYNQVYEIGYLLVDAKRVLGKNDSGKFLEWVDNNFPFSHRTANNFMNVYKACMGTPELANMFKKSILYKISSKNYPDELRQELFDNAKGVYNFDQKELAIVTKKFVNGEIDLDSEEVKDLTCKQKNIQEDKRYIAEMRGMKSDLNKRLYTFKKLNKIGLLEPTLSEEDNRALKKHVKILKVG